MTMEQIRASLANLPEDDRSQDFLLKDGTSTRYTKKSILGKVACINQAIPSANSAYEAKLAGIIASRS